MKLEGMANLGDLWNRVSGGTDRAICSQVLDISTNNETSFFRDKNVFQAFELNAVPEILNRFGSDSLKIWCAACSTGQEPYSLSMILNESAVKLGLKFWEILATDFSDRALERAKSGKYSQIEIQRGLPANKLIRYFDKSSSDEWVIRQELQTHIRFQKQNLLEPTVSGEFEIIFLRNMLIYQSVENKKKIVEEVAKRLKRNGCLFLGGAESLMGISNSFEQVSSQGAFFYRKK